MASTINASTTLGLISSADTSGVLQLQSNGTATVTVDTSGNVGVGTSSPPTKLSVHGTGPQLNLYGISTGSLGANFSYDGVTGNLGIATNGYNASSAPQMVLSASGNLGLGVTPSAWATFTGLQVGALGGVNIGGATGDNFYAMNAYYNAGWKYAATGYTALMYRMVNGEHRWSNAASGTAGNTISFTQAMTLDASGNFALGTTPVLGYLQTTQIGTSDSTLYRHHRHNSGGGTAHADACTQTTTAITTAKAIAGIEDASFLLVRGSDGSGNEFMDLVITQNSGTPTVITSKTLSGSPAARTYAISSFNLTLAMASGTYKTNCLWWQLSSR